MPLLSTRGLGKAYGARTLFQGVSLGIEDGERLGLIGPNGAGKSTLVRILAGLEEPDQGEVTRRRGVRIAFVPQSDEFPAGATPLGVVAGALLEPGRTPDDEAHAHERETRAAIVLGRVGMTRVDVPVEELSGGWRKRLSLARALVREPDLLILDEPTNHLDLDGILWLEDLLDESSFAAIVVTHDRYFLEEVTNRVVELNAAYPGGTLDADGPYSRFLEIRAAFLAAQSQQEANLAARVRDDVTWLMRGARARRTKAKGRIDESARRMAELAALRERNAPARASGFEFGATGRRSRELLVAKGVAKSLGGRTLFAGVDLMLGPGACLGVVGPNGSGKTTLVRVLAGQLEPDAGEIRRATSVRVASLAQDRARLDPAQLLRRALCPEGETVVFRGEGVHVSSWARRFLFRTEQLDLKVGELSGGEQARILIADLMRLPADLLILDEPTNDLDIGSLEVLEDAVREFPGAVVLVTHDRFMLDRLATQVLGLDGRGGSRIVADVAQWLAAQEAAAAAAKPAGAKPRPSAPAAPAPRRPGRLGYNEQREWDGMEAAIEAAESRVTELERLVATPAAVADHARLHEHYHELEAAQAQVAALYARWAELEAKRSAG